MFRKNKNENDVTKEEKTLRGKIMDKTQEIKECGKTGVIVKVIVGLGIAAGAAVGGFIFGMRRSKSYYDGCDDDYDMYDQYEEDEDEE